jgi:DNA-binding transcriptional LysR family regulator
MDKLHGLMAFVKTADLGSFATAGRVLEISPSAVGKAVARLEQQLGVRLFQRSTRRVQLTEEGRLFHERCRRILDDLDDAQSMLSQTRETPRGKLRVSAPIVAYHFLLPLVPEFVARYPEVELDFDFNDRIVELIEEGVDVAIRTGDLPDSSLVARPLRHYRQRICASPAYLKAHGTPVTPRALELEQHAALRFRFPNSGKLFEWPFPRVAGEPELRLRTALTCNNMEALRGATLRGLGIACMPDFLVDEAVADGRLVSLFEDQLGIAGQFQAIWPSSRHLSPKVRVFVDHLSQALS